MEVEQQGKNGSDLRPWRPFLWIVLASAAAHLWCLGSQFYLDDASIIRDNEFIRVGRFWDGALTSLTTLGYVIQYKLFGMSPVAFHAVNWLLHTAVACVLFGFSRDFLKDRAPLGTALFAALLFAVHPLASEIPNYARTQDLAWVTLFSLGASWLLLRFLRDGGWRCVAGMVLCIVGATLSKGPGLFHALMMVGAVGMAFMTSAHWNLLKRRVWWLAGAALLGLAGLWLAGVISVWLQYPRQWVLPRFIGHAYTLARVFWEFSWRAVVPVSLCSDHQIAESLVPPGSGWFNIPDKGAMVAAAAMLALTAVSLLFAWRKPTRLFGVCLFLFIATMLFRVMYLVPEFMPEYRIYPGMPWFCLGAAVLLGALWRRIPGGGSPAFVAVLILLPCIVLSARRSFVWHDLDTLCADVLAQYPAQARAVWELHDRDIAAGEWQKVINRQRDVWPLVFRKFIDENTRLAPKRELPSGLFSLSDVACRGQYALALAHTRGPAAGLAEIRNLEQFMRLNRWDQKVHWGYFYQSKLRVLEQAGNYKAAFDFMRDVGMNQFSRADIRRVEMKLRQGS